MRIEEINEIREKMREYRYTKSINITRVFENEYPELAVVILLQKYPFYEWGDVLCIKFTHVVNVKIGDLEGIYPMAIHIVDIAERQLEGLRYSISETENEVFSFQCRDFTFCMMDITK